MPSIDTHDVGKVPHVPTEALEAVLELLREMNDQPIAVTEAEAGKLLGVSGKTVSRLPAEEVGRFKIGTAVRYSRSRLVEFVALQIGK